MYIKIVQGVSAGAMDRLDVTAPNWVSDSQFNNQGLAEKVVDISDAIYNKIIAGHLKGDLEI